MKRLVSIAIALGMALSTVGCGDFERTSFQSLSASKAVIDQAQEDYEAKTLPQTAQAYAIINQAKTAQTVAVDAMLKYEAVKADKVAGASQQQVVIVALAQIPVLIAQVKALYTGGSK